MSKKDEALKIAIEVMNNYQNGWMPDEMASAMIACQKALKKEWQGLTDDEVIDLIDIDCPPNKAICGSTKGIIKLAKAIEQKLKEKNHGTT